jgi:hypothetical protein
LCSVVVVGCQSATPRGSGEGEGEPAVCGAATVLDATAGNAEVPADYDATAALAGTPGLGSSCSGSLGAYAIFRFVVPVRANVHAEVVDAACEGEPGQHCPVYGLSVRTACTDAGSELACGEPHESDSSVDVADQPAGRELFFIVTGGSGDFFVQVEARPLVTSGAVCDRNASPVCVTSGEACLGQPSHTTCTTAIPLHQGDACDATDTAHVCGDGTKCLGPVCVHPEQGVCDAAPAATLGDNTVVSTADDVLTSASCAGDGTMAVLAYTVQGPRVSVTASVPSSVADALWIRAACTDPTTEFGCDARGLVDVDASVTAKDLTAGTVIFVFTETRAQSVTVTLREANVNPLSAGTPCDPTSTTDLCDTGLTCLPAPSGTGDTCQ